MNDKTAADAFPERVSTGVAGLDEMIEGGIVKGSVTLVTGTTGSGKTTFCSQFLWEGLQKGETCLYITLEQLPEQIEQSAKDFGWDFENADADGTFKILYIDPGTNPGHTADNVYKAIQEVSPDRVAIDSFSVMEAYWEEKEDVRDDLNDLALQMRDGGWTTVITAEMPDPEGNQLTRHGIAEFVVDGVIVLGGLSIGQTTFRSIQVIKMRRTNIVEDVRSIDLTDSGIIVQEEGF